MSAGAPESGAIGLEDIIPYRAPAGVDPDAYAESVTRAAGRHFGAGYFFFDAPTRRAMNALYAFARISDDIADEPIPGSPDPASARKRLFQSWRSELARAWQGPDDGSFHPCIRAIARAGRAHELSLDLLVSLVDGCESDIDVRRYDTYEGLLAYVENVAVTVGLLMLEIFHCRNTQTEPPMRALGRAFQLTNILRDVAEDMRRSRIYIAQTDLAIHNLTAESFESAVLGRTADAGMSALIVDYATRAKDKYLESERLLASGLPSGARKAVASMKLIYESILALIQRDPLCVLSGPPRLSRARKLALLTRAAFS